MMLSVIALAVLVLFRLIMDSIRDVGLQRFAGDAFVSLVDQEARMRPVEQSIRLLEGEVHQLFERMQALETLMGSEEVQEEELWTRPP